MKFENNTTIFIHGNVHKNVVCQMSAKFFAGLNVLSSAVDIN